MIYDQKGVLRYKSAAFGIYFELQREKITITLVFYVGTANKTEIRIGRQTHAREMIYIRCFHEGVYITNKYIFK